MKPTAQLEPEPEEEFAFVEVHTDDDEDFQFVMLPEPDEEPLEEIEPLQGYYDHMEDYGYYE